MKLEKEEKELLKSYENGEWKTIEDFEKRKSDFIRYA